MLIPPVSIFLMIGYAKYFRQQFMLFLPSFLFLLAHSVFPNKQERFILPVIPYVIILGIIGWEKITKSEKLKRFANGSWKFFWVINGILLIAFSTFYSKRASVEAMYCLYQQKDLKNFFYDCSESTNIPWPPQFYSGTRETILVAFDEEKFRMEDAVMMFQTGQRVTPTHVVFYDSKNLESRIAKYESLVHCRLELIQVCKPAFIDLFLHWLNHHNKATELSVYRVLK